MKLVLFIAGLFIRNKRRPSLFSKALSEGIKDMFAEMGYKSGKGE